MALREGLALFLLLLLHASLSRAASEPAREDPTPINRTSFPPAFIFGASSSAYQYEGAAAVGGRGTSIWDTFTHKHPEKIGGNGNGDVAADSYHRYKEDVKLVKQMGFDAYRFSISWVRILPNGRPSGGVNKEGIRYYNNLIDELISNGLQPFVTIYHWDLPQLLDDEYGGFLNTTAVADLRAFADICFTEFGDRVKHWITINEPWTYSVGGYSWGIYAPGRCSSWELGNCSIGDSATEPYIVAHNLLLAHAATVKLYREKYQASQKGIIGITLNGYWVLPASTSNSDYDATQRALDFSLGWFLDPLTSGEYPHNMRTLVGERLPKFTKRQSDMIKGSFDFIGLNYYTSSYATPLYQVDPNHISYSTDSHTVLTEVWNGIALGPRAASPWLCVYPAGMKELLIYIKRRYQNPAIYITENGVDEVNNETLPLEEALQDKMRVDYYHQHLLFLEKAIRMGGVDVRGYFAWSLLDNFEWSDGYTVRFGLNYVDFKDGQKRYPKQSAIWFQHFLRGRYLPIETSIASE